MTRAEALLMLDAYSFVAARVILVAPRRNDRWPALAILQGMRDRFPPDGSDAKAQRWLGFAQGVLHAAGVYDLHALKNHSKTKRVELPDCLRGVEP
jgi:hypothetical protein